MIFLKRLHIQYSQLLKDPAPLCFAKPKDENHMMRSSAYREIKSVFTLNQFPERKSLLERGVGFPEGKRSWLLRRKLVSRLDLIDFIGHNGP